jgi:general secretion pathway protein G
MPYQHRTGFTLIELLVVMAVLALLATLISPRYFQSVDRAKEVTLRASLQEARRAIDQHFTDKGRYPASLQELVDERYLRSLPVDPVTDRSDTWVIVGPRDPRLGSVYDIRSGAQGASANGTPYASW